MKQKLFLLFSFIHIFFLSNSQDSILHRVILIGDAGEMNAQQIKILADATGRIITGKTSVFYLGDNIYPRGIGLPGSKTEETTKNILLSQYKHLRSKGASVYFIPGNLEWDKSGSKGLSKIKYQSRFLQEQGDSLVRMVPANGCPDPVEIDLTDSLVVIAFDSEWWLYPFSKDNPDADCDCKTKSDITTRLEELIYKNRYKLILLADHHPFQSYGRYGGSFSWKDHIFPLTAINKNLYLPLPVVGSLYPLLRNVFSNPEDLHHPLYKDMIKKIDAATASQPNIIHVSGHEHSLQFIKENQIQIVSGSGSKEPFVMPGKNALFTDTKPGYVTADLLSGNNLRFTFHIYSDTGFKTAFTYLQAYTDIERKEEKAVVAIKGDSITINPHLSFNNIGKFSRFLFGENFRKEYAAPTTVPVIRISEIKGGLIPTKRGGWHQSRSLRLKDKEGKEWVLRSVDKYPEILLPEQLRETFAANWVKDAMSAQHPFSALVVPLIANAVNVPHSNPVIGYVAPDKNLGIYSKLFSNTLCLLEEREPAGKSDPTNVMFSELNKDNDNSIDSTQFLRARLLDLFLGDWDRYDDQWRWADIQKGKGKKYMAVPRDRDQVFHVTEGLLPSIISKPWNLPFLHNFDGKIKKINAFFFESRHLNARFLNQFTFEEWMQVTKDFTHALTDSVLEAALRKLPAASYHLRHDELLKAWKERRKNISSAMATYYHFLNKIIDIQTSDKNEQVEINDAPDNGLTLTIHKLSKKGNTNQNLFNRTFDAAVTKEIRLFTGNGNDSIVLNNKNSTIKLRIIGGTGDKVYNVLETKRKVRVYERLTNTIFKGETKKLVKHLSDDSLNTVYEPTNLYNITEPLYTGGYNLDDGFIFSAGLKYIKQEGFRKTPFASMHLLMAAHSFSTSAFRLMYKGEWIKTFGKADITVQAFANAPNNTINFFGRGNETPFTKTGDFKTFYRTRFSTYQIDPALRWQKNKGTTFSLGPSLYYYQFDSDGNTGRLISNTSSIGSYDSLTVNKSKLHLGIIAQYINDKRNSKIIPQWGSYLKIKVQAYKGIGNFAGDFVQIIPEVALYKSLNSKSSIILAERLGGTIGIGKSAFYQSAFIGGQENLLGYSQYRFAGKHSFYNNLELRIKLADVASYIVPGQFGIIGFWDIGRVWEENETSGKWQNGTGGGIYFAPASMVAFSFILGNSTEGLYPYFTMGLRF